LQLETDSFLCYARVARFVSTDSLPNLLDVPRRQVAVTGAAQTAEAVGTVVGVDASPDPPKQDRR
jgi:hypothetical protein